MNEDLFGRSKVEPPCKDCERRCVGCHSTCDGYAKFKEERSAEHRNATNFLDHVTEIYTYDAVRRRNRKSAASGYSMPNSRTKRYR